MFANVTLSAGMLVSVAVGGAMGAVSRYLLMSLVGLWLGGGFPYATLAVNVLGSFALGALLEIMALVWSPGPELRAMIVVGFLGAFTTFSTFSMDVIFLTNGSGAAMAWLYVAVSVLLSIAAFVAGLHVLRAVVG